MATISEDDYQSLVDAIEFQIEDIAALVPEGFTLEQELSKIAPGLLDYINSRLANRYPLQESPLESQTLTLLTYGCIAEVLYLAYRRSVINEKSWPDEWRERFDNWLDLLAKGYAQLSAPTKDEDYTPRFDGEDRIFTMRPDDDFTNENETLKDLDVLLP